MDRGRRLGAHAYVTQMVLPAEGLAPGCSFEVVRREGDGARSLLQLWEPLPPERRLDTLRVEFLQRFAQAEAMDPGACHLGYDADRLWFLQELSGTPLLRLWAETDAQGRNELRSKLLKELSGSSVARALWPEVVGLKPGRILTPRLLGTAPGDPLALILTLEQSGLAPAPGPGPRTWAGPPDLADASRVPIRGRAQTLTYLKSLMFGLGAATPMERIVLLLGEVGLGHERLCDWVAAAAESEGIWVSSLDAQPLEKGGAFLERVVQDQIAGQEAELYAALPGVARALSRRLATFAFLRGGRRLDGSERRVEPAEVDAALEALAFAQARHPRLIQIRSLERADPEVHDLVKELVQASRTPWVLASRSSGQRSCTTALKNHPEAATVVLDRLEDAHIVEVLEGLLGPHDLPAALVAELCRACLGNPGLLQNFLEMAQVRGALVRAGDRWGYAAGLPVKVEMQEDLVQGILAGRLLRVNPAALALVRYLALADAGLPLPVLGRVLGLDGDGVEEALNTAQSAKLALESEGGAQVSSAQVRDLALAKMPPNEIIRCARLLLKVLEEDGGRPFLSVRLQSFALDPATALTQVLQAIERELPGPRKARRVVEDALKLKPGPAQEARLWEFLADNWCIATEGDRLPAEEAQGRSPFAFALEALDRSLAALGAPGAAEAAAQAARLHRKKALVEMRLRRFAEAAEALDQARRLLADHPFHPEQPRLSLALGRHHLLQGQGAKGIKVLEEGLALLAQKGAGDPMDHVALLLELGQAQGQRALFQRALETLHAAKRLLEHSGDGRRLVAVLQALGAVHLSLGQAEPAGACYGEAMGVARLLDDVELIASCHLRLGILDSLQELLAPALAHLDSAFRRFATLGDQALATQAQAWKARTLGALGDAVLAELLQLQASAVPADLLTPLERADRVFLEGEIAGFRGAWADAQRHFQGASNRCEEAGLLWRERLARLRSIQAQACAGGGPAALKSAWIRLEGLKGPIEASGSRWLELEWHRAHALVLSQSGDGEGIIAEALQAWGEVLAGARELRFTAMALEASVQCARLLLGRGERLGARSRVQDAFAAFQELWSRVPEHFAKAFLERRDIQLFRATAESAGVPFTLPDRVDPLADWSPTQANLPMVPSIRATP